MVAKTLFILSLLHMCGQHYSLSPYILFNTIPPCPSQTGRRMDGGEGRGVEGKYASQ